MTSQIVFDLMTHSTHIDSYIVSEQTQMGEEICCCQELLLVISSKRSFICSKE